MAATQETGRNERAQGDAHAVRRLHWGCGPITPSGWINCDMKDGPGVDVCCDIRDGLPFADETIDYISSQHVLQELTIHEQEPALHELRRVLRPGGVLRLSLPDLDRAIAAYDAGDREYFGIWGWDTIDGDFLTWLVWLRYYNETLFTYPFAEELARKAGFSDVRRVAYRETASPYPDIVDLDSRENESFYLEAVR